MFFFNTIKCVFYTVNCVFYTVQNLTKKKKKGDFQDFVNYGKREIWDFQDFEKGDLGFSKREIWDYGESDLRWRKLRGYWEGVSQEEGRERLKF